MNEDWAVGFSVAAPFVGSLDYGRSWAGRYVDRELDLAVYRFGPAAAYRVNDWLSLGATVGVNYANLDLKVAIPTPGTDGKFQIENADQWELSWGLSALLDSGGCLDDGSETGRLSQDEEGRE